ncbi:hypothetical protein C8N40_112125 [Pontibacter mucosus]|uniref:Uncharacterized protein n=1 Tax=Pontibacter mucosus TaxID=1649266 RepID=A0A2T5YCR7_9BACT|nr:hypothetical protein C8N40_112125 [Pontibacter mucosus]
MYASLPKAIIYLPAIFLGSQLYLSREVYTLS